MEKSNQDKSSIPDDSGIDEKGLNFYISALDQNNLVVMKLMTKIIALEVRGKLERFHDSLSNEQMKELNPLIREGIFNALFALANCHKEMPMAKYIDYSVRQILSFGAEELELYPYFKKSVKFKSEFLNEQYEIGNIYWVRGKGNEFIQLKTSSSFTDVGYGSRHSHRDKITTFLRKEGYKFDEPRQGYVQDIKA